METSGTYAGRADVVALVFSPEVHMRVAQSRGEHVVAFARAAKEAYARLKSTGATVLMIEYLQNEAPAIGVLADKVRAEVPRLPLVVMVREPMLAAPDLVALVRRSGAHVIAANDRSYPEVFSLTVRATDGRRRLQQFGETAYERLPDPERRVARYVIEHGGAVCHIKELGQALGVTVPTINRWLALTQVRARELLVWGRLIGVGVRLEATLLPIEQIAHDHGFASLPALSNQMRKYAAVRPTDVRSKAGATPMLDHFMERLARRPSAMTATSAPAASGHFLPPG